MIDSRLRLRKRLPIVLVVVILVVLANKQAAACLEVDHDLRLQVSSIPRPRRWTRSRVGAVGIRLEPMKPSSRRSRDGYAAKISHG